MPLRLNDNSEPRHPQGRSGLVSYAQKDPRCQPDERIMGSMGKRQLYSPVLDSHEWLRSCRWKMLDSGIVASLVGLDDRESFHDCSNDDGNDLEISELYDDLNFLIPQRRLLKMTPDVMSLLAGVSRPVQVGQGYILCGPYLAMAMVPITKQVDRSILWHFESK